MATVAEERRQRLAELNIQIQEREAAYDDDHLPTLENEQELEAMYNARTDIREDLGRLGRIQGRAQEESRANPPVPAPVARERGQAQILSLGDRFVQSPQFQAFLAAAGGRMPATGRIPGMDGFRVGGFRDLGLRADLVTGGSSTSAGAFVVTDRFQELTDLGRRELTIRDLVRNLRTGSDLVEFVRQTSRTNNAAAVAEATAAAGASGAKPESATAFEVVQQPVETFANWMPVTRQAVADVAQMRDLIDTELRDNVAEEFDRRIVTDIQGTSGTQAQAWDTNILTTTRKGRTKVRTIGRRTPTAYVLHPNDWQTIDLLQDNEARYFFGGPSVLGTPRLWGLPVVENEAAGEGTGLVADFRRAAVWDRESTQIYVSDSHSDFFTRNLLAILAEMRAAIGVLQPNAFVELDLTA